MITRFDWDTRPYKNDPKHIAMSIKPNRLDWDARPYKNDPKHYDIFFCGDSWTWGAELEIENPDPNFRETHIFSYYVGQRTNKSVYNISHPGESNDWIVRSMFDWFECGNSADVAVIQWTYWCRVSYHNLNNEFLSVKPQLTVPRTGKSFADPTFPFWNNYYEHCYTDYSGYQMWFKNLIFTDLYLKSKGVKPIYLTIQPELYNMRMDYYSRYKEVGKIQDLFALLGDSKNYVNTERENYDPCAGHPNSKGHSIIADYIISQL